MKTVILHGDVTRACLCGRHLIKPLGWWQVSMALGNIWNFKTHSYQQIRHIFLH